MTLRNSVLAAGSLMFLAPGCAQKTEAPAPAPAQTAKPPTPTAPAGTPGAAPAPAEAPRPKRMDPCTNEGEHAVTASGIPVECEHGRWDDVGVGFVGVSKAGSSRLAARRLRA